MAEIADLSRVEEFAPKIALALAQGKSVRVTGRLGSGRSSLARMVRDAVPRTALVDFVSMKEPDAAVHGLLQAASHLVTKAARAQAATDDAPLAERARKVGELLAQQGSALCIKVPPSWDLRAEADADMAEESRTYEASDLGMDAYQLQRARDLLKGLLSATNLRVALFTTTTFTPKAVDWSPHETFALPPVRANLAKLRDEAFWGEYAAHAKELADHLGIGPARFSPFEMRLAVGVAALGTPIPQVVTNLYAGGTLGLSTLLREALNEPRHADLRAPIHRLAMARVPVKREALLAIAKPPEEHAPLLDRCIGYVADDTDDKVRITESIRLTLLDVGSANTDGTHADTDAANMGFVAYHRALDGAVRAEDVNGASIVNWLERVHHLANSGDLGRDEWATLELRCREFFLDRARLLSVRKQYSAAADLYEKCVALAPDDPYGWHYLGYNLDHANTNVQRAEEAYTTAIDLDKPNPWWNSRYITFLIRRARFSDAVSEWEDALERVDPDGLHVRESGHLAMGLHRWVASEWLEYGELAKARAVIALIPPTILQSRQRLRRLATQIEDAEEALALGDSVYPDDVPMEERWKPRLLPSRKKNGMRLHAWFPGRVIAGSHEGVRLVIATPDKSRVIVAPIAAAQWEAATRNWDISPEDALEYFVEVGVYDRADGPMTILPVSPPRNRRSLTPT